MLRSLIVGIDHYLDDQINDLSYAGADAKSFFNLLEKCIHPSERQTQLLLNEEATKRNIMVTIGENLARVVKPEDVVLLYFSCHGSPETETSLDNVSRYLVVHDTEYENIYATGIDMETELKRWYERMEQPKLVLLFIDACFSGRAGGRTFEGPRLYRNRQSGFRNIQPISLRDLDLGEGRIMITACDDNQVAREDKKLEHGIFTYHLMEALTSPAPGQTTVVLTSLYEEVTRAVRNYTNGRQIPILNGRSRFAQFPRLYHVSNDINTPNKPAT